ncbi:UbiA family prenyltransferase [Methanobacterium formicicum]|uniref:UbiA family prenyltransferase n=1 Tax=Methanobacterium formicicum TaxID=2162 RepID=UPI002493220D|nr:UbiA family prenyltransferase [Methanobacterium formicicum]
MNTIRTRLNHSPYRSIIKILVILTSSSVFIALSGCLKTFFSFSLYGAPLSYPLLMATFLVIYSVYGLNKITDTKEDQLNTPERSKIISSHLKLFKYTTFSALILSLIIGILHSWKVLLVLIFPLIAGLIYSIKFHPRIPRLKDICGVKSFTVALSWTVGNTFLPVIGHRVDFILMGLAFYFFFIKSFINTVLFDLLDRKGDKQSKTITIPVVMGKSRTIQLLLILNTTLILVIQLALAFKLLPVFIIPLIFCTIYGYLYIFYFSRQENRLEMDILVDGEWILVAFIIILLVK